MIPGASSWFTPDENQVCQVALRSPPQAQVFAQAVSPQSPKGHFVTHGELGRYLGAKEFANEAWIRFL